MEESHIMNKQQYRDIAGIHTSFSRARADLVSVLAQKSVTVSESATFTECIAAINDINNDRVVLINTGKTLLFMGGTQTVDISSCITDKNAITSKNVLFLPTSIEYRSYNGSYNNTGQTTVTYSDGKVTQYTTNTNWIDLSRCNTKVFLIIPKKLYRSGSIILEL